MTRGFWSDLRAAEFRSLPADLVAVLPIGAVEQHGPHLPVSVDACLAATVAERMLDHLDEGQHVLVLPAQAIGKSDEHLRHPGTLSLSAETLLAVLRETGASVARAGVERLVFLNGHGGNSALLDVAARDLRIAHDMIVATCAWSAFAMLDEVFPGQDLTHDIHAGDIETSAMLAARPDLVDMGKARDFRPATQDWQRDFPSVGIAGQPARPGWIIDDLNCDGACGNAAAATAEKGEALIGNAARNFALFLKEFARFDHRAPG